MAIKKAATKEQASEILTIQPVRIKAVRFKIEGTAPYMQARFSEKSIAAMKAKMDGTVKKGTKVRENRVYEQDYQNAMHIAEDGWQGIPAGSVRAALISACRLVGFKMTLAKLSVFVEEDGLDRVDSLPLIKIYGASEPNSMAVRNATGVFDIRIRPLWKKWFAYITIRFDEDQFSTQDVLNLLSRVGMQVGLGEGRPDSRASAGLGYGTFSVTAPSSEEEATDIKQAEKNQPIGYYLSHKLVPRADYAAVMEPTTKE